MDNYLKNLQFEYCSLVGINVIDYPNPYQVKSIMRIVDAHGNSDRTCIPNNPNHPDWNNQGAFGLPGYIQWLNAGNIPTKPETDAELLERYRSQALSVINDLSSRIRGMLITEGEAFIYAAKRREIALFDSGERDPEVYKGTYSYAEAQKREKKIPNINQIRKVIEKYRASVNRVDPLNRERDAIRIIAKADITSASTIAEIKGIIDIATTDFDALENLIITTRQ